MILRKNANVETIAYKFRAYPSDSQRIMFAKTFGCCRYLWNRLLSDHTTLYNKIGVVPDNTPADYKYLDECNWLQEVDSMALDSVRVDQKQAFEKFYNKTAGYPVFKCKADKQSYRMNCSSKAHPNLYFIRTGVLKLPKINEPLIFKQHREIKDGGRLKSATISKDSTGEYYISLLFEYPEHTFTREYQYQDAPRFGGLDMKLGGLYVDSDGHHCNMPQFFHKTEEKLARGQRKLSKMTFHSKNYERQRRKVASLHAKIKRQREDFHRKEAWSLIRKYDVIVIEDLDLKEMAREEHGKSVSDNGWGKFVLFLTWLSQKTGRLLIKVDRFYPSTQLCSNCRNSYRIDKYAKTYECPTCGLVIDRDENSALNLKIEGIRIYQLRYTRPA